MMYDTAIVGAGPVGLLLAALLGQKGLRVLLLEKRTEPTRRSHAIGITPPSLEILAQLGLADTFVHRGIPIRDCHVHGHRGLLGCASFRNIPGPHPYILSLPQHHTIALLENHLASLPNVQFLRNTELSSLSQDPNGVTLHAPHLTASAHWLIACDGHRSTVRNHLRILTRGAFYGCHFLMGDFLDHSPLGSDAHLWFTPHGAVESFPLPDAHRRWVVQTTQPLPDAPPGHLTATILQRTGLDLQTHDQLHQNAFSPRWMQARTYRDRRVLLCGDAAHLMSPIGGQGMNTGWADAEFLAQALTSIQLRGRSPEPLLAAYEHYRRRAALAATHRAARGMWLGTRTGAFASRVRDLAMRHLLFKGPLARRLGPHFAMLTIPHRTTAHTPKNLWNP